MALLALLSSGPMTGYDVGKQFSASVGHVWHAPDSQIYPEMRRLNAEGLLSARPVPWGSRGATKTEYALTAEGEEELRRWQERPPTYVRERDPARLRAAYFEWAPPGAAAAQLRAHIAHHEEQRLQTLRVIDELQRRTQPTLARRLSRYPEQEQERIVAFKVFAYEGQLARVEQEIAWAKRGLALLDTLGGPEAGPPVAGGGHGGPGPDADGGSPAGRA